MSAHRSLSFRTTTAPVMQAEGLGFGVWAQDFGSFLRPGASEGERVYGFRVPEKADAVRQSSNASEYGGSCSTERAQSKISHQSGPPLLKPNGTCNGDLELPSRPVLCKPTLRLDGYGNRKRRTLTLNRKSKMLNPKSKRKESRNFRISEPYVLNIQRGSRRNGIADSSGS